MNRHPIDRSEPPVDPTDQLVDRRTQVLILFDVLTRRDGDLYEDDFTEPFGVFFEEDFHRVKFLRYSFDVVQSVDSDDDLDTFEATTERRYSLNDGVLRERLWFEEAARLAELIPETRQI
jgi:hypothetical protein